jgi:hypothetical protein
MDHLALVLDTLPEAFRGILDANEESPRSSVAVDF